MFFNRKKQEVTESFTAYFDSEDEFASELKKELEKSVLKKGLGIIWVTEAESATVYIQFSKIKEGSQALRYVSSGILGHAVLKVEGHITSVSGELIPFNFGGRGMFGGLLGGGSNDQLKSIAYGLGMQIANKVIKLHETSQLRLA